MIQGYLFDDHLVNLDDRTANYAGSWHGPKRDGHLTAWGSNLIKWVYDQLKDVESPRMVDIGANTGSFTLLPAILPDLQIYSFEPVPFLAEICKANISVNNLLSSVIFSELALSDVEGTGIMKIPHGRGVGQSLLDGEPLRFKDYYTCRVTKVPLDTVIDVPLKMHNFNWRIPVHLIKIDVEGHELMVLKGARNTIVRHRPIIVTEYHEVNTRQHGYERIEIKRWLEGIGYRTEAFGHEDLIGWPTG